MRLSQLTVASVLASCAAGANVGLPARGSGATAGHARALRQDANCETILEAAGNIPELSSLVDMLSDWVLDPTVSQVVSGAGNFYFFAPRNAAFQKVGPIPEDDSRKVLLTHIVHGQLKQRAPGAQIVKSISQIHLTVDIPKASVRAPFTEAYILQPIPVCNGALYVIDAVLMPHTEADPGTSPPDDSPASVPAASLRSGHSGTRGEEDEVGVIGVADGGERAGSDAEDGVVGLMGRSAGGLRSRRLLTGRAASSLYGDAPASYGYYGWWRLLANWLLGVPGQTAMFMVEQPSGVSEIHHAQSGTSTLRQTSADALECTGRTACTKAERLGPQDSLTVMFIGR